MREPPFFVPLTTRDKPPSAPYPPYTHLTPTLHPPYTHLTLLYGGCNVDVRKLYICHGVMAPAMRSERVLAARKKNIHCKINVGTPRYIQTHY